MFYHIIAAINILVENFREFVDDESKFSRSRKWDFKDFLIFESFRNKTTNRHEITRYVKNFTNKYYKHIKRQNFCQRRIFIKPEAWKSLSSEYLKQIRINEERRLFKTFKGFRLFAGDGSDFNLVDTEELRREFNVKNTMMKKNPAQGKFSSIMDVLNGFILDGILGDFKEDELKLMHKNLKNIKELVNFKKSIFIFDRGYVGMELYARIIELNSYFVVRIRKDDYIKERSKINSNDSPIKLNLIGCRLKKFHDSILNKKYNKELYLNLRIVTIELGNGEIETLLTNLTPEMMTTEDICQIYDYQWGIETNHNTFKNRLNIENYSETKRITIEQDIYSQFIFYNIFCYYNSYLNILVNLRMHKKGKCDEDDEYQIDQANLIRNLNDGLMKVIVNPINDNIREFTSDLIWESSDEPNKIKRNRMYNHQKSKPFIRYRMRYQDMS